MGIGRILDGLRGIAVGAGGDLVDGGNSSALTGGVGHRAVREYGPTEINRSEGDHRDDREHQSEFNKALSAVMANLSPEKPGLSHEFTVRYVVPQGTTVPGGIL